jgi:hypothetical protein
MAFSSPSFPAGGFSQHAPNIQAVGAWAGRHNDDTGQVTVHGCTVISKNVGSLTWEALAYLETILAESRAHAGVLNQISVVTGSIEAAAASLSAKLDALAVEMSQLKEQQSQLLQALGLAVIPAWQTAEEVERGDDMGLERPSAHALGLAVEYWAMNGDREDRIEDHNVEPWMSVLSITPPAGSLVRANSVVKVLVNLEG